MRFRPFTRLAGAGLALLVLANGPAAAQSDFDLSPEQPGRPHHERVAAAVDAVPEGFAFVRPGYLTVAVNPSGGPPIATYATDAATVIGADPDYASLVADSLGLKLDLVPVAWADWPLGLTSGKYDAVISNVGVTEERKLKFDFSSYRQGLHGIFARKGSGIGRIAEPKDIAGLRIIVGAGTNQEHILLEWDRRNLAAGLKPAELQYFDNEATGLVALRSGRADAIVQPNGQLIFIAARDGNIERLGTLSAGWPERSDVAIATRKGSGLADALTAATNALIKDGSLQRALDRWQLGEEILPRSQTNPPGLPKF
ncbi:ABC transporter substrate-binding protein [Aureimonas leprariae]|uniref:ABC transporter substrate-binding protein n=1 Tax=Plantimonas leprariae TaxID=2615207 RepID=A0A7V7TVF4_9HYPH|nr:ABC transporter substrate-binding protein [Aureimonas leprariae]KAB0677509.1 ABC transporter substrate-binding protein [Aureimonas leprariae]